MDKYKRSSYFLTVPKDYKEAVKWYKLAADQGNEEAQYKLGNCYYNGNGVDKNIEEAVKWYKLAAEQGHAKARNALDSCRSEK